MVNKYLSRGRMYILFKKNTAIAECVVTDEGDGILEIKNLATNPIFQVGTSDSPLTFLQKNRLQSPWS
ncbi:hypothetical protein HMPREF0548_1163 [Lactobacillus ultunensis DSM 16047]|uniref:Uncharacterized protein n=1 Tax=Lactobacillus ultunensis DSM 16047 TaxID=525365 RepID=C2ENB7_9LACO|nr:hypothetical protein HMPREF0548_1163 [Lactobacillus ultunensis DSM 16047]